MGEMEKLRKMAHGGTTHEKIKISDSDMKKREGKSNN